MIHPMYDNMIFYSLFFTDKVTVSVVCLCLVSMCLLMLFYYFVFNFSCVFLLSLYEDLFGFEGDMHIVGSYTHT